MRSRFMLTATSLAFAIVALTGCATTGVSSTTGYAVIAFYKEGVGATEHDVADKTGKACTNNILGIIAIGDASVEAAKRAGGIKKVSTVDKDIMNILGLFGQNCTIVTGS
jgi:hypothetical protein